MATPKPAAVATALWIDLPHSVIRVTPNTPPPIPIIADMMPIRPPSPARAAPPGSSSRSFQSRRPKKNCSDSNSAMPPNRPVSTRPDTWSAITEPSSVPPTIHGPQLRKTWKSTAPRLAWAERLRIEVATMTASEVPTATCISLSS